MYKLLGRVPSGHPHMIQAITAHLKLLGKAINQPDLESKQFYISWIEKIIALKTKFDGLMNSCFNENKIFEAQIHMALQQVINETKNAPEFCSLYVDTNFKKLAKGGGEVNVDLVNGNVISVFRFLNEKDLFEKYYKGHLAKRLIYSKGLMEDAEKSLLTLLKVECGTQFTSKLEGMFIDSQLSLELTSSFRNHLKTELDAVGDRNTKLPVEISLNVLTSTNWPYSTTNSGCNLPPILNSVASQFELFYHAQHSSRKLTWLKNLGTADVITKLPLFKKEKELNMSTFAMTLLVTCFNTLENDPVDFSRLVEHTEIPLIELKRALQTLALGKHKLLIKLSKGREILHTDSFKVNLDFNSNQTKIKILTIASKEETKAEAAKEREETVKDVENSRKHQIEATIVRIMKSRKTMIHNALISSLIEQLNSRFTPDMKMVKERIEELIEREFIKRDEDVER
jgi:cullin 3